MERIKSNHHTQIFSKEFGILLCMCLKCACLCKYRRPHTVISENKIDNYSKCKDNRYKINTISDKISLEQKYI